MASKYRSVLATKIRAEKDGERTVHIKHNNSAKEVAKLLGLKW
jgi:hypothetical protein